MKRSLELAALVVEPTVTVTSTRFMPAGAVTRHWVAVHAEPDTRLASFAPNLTLPLVRFVPVTVTTVPPAAVSDQWSA